MRSIAASLRAGCRSIRRAWPTGSCAALLDPALFARARGDCDRLAGITRRVFIPFPEASALVLALIATLPLPEWGHHPSGTTRHAAASRWHAACLIATVLAHHTT